MRSLDITASSAVVACLPLMVLVEAGSRQLIVGVRYGPAGSGQDAAVPPHSRGLTLWE